MGLHAAAAKAIITINVLATHAIRRPCLPMASARLLAEPLIENWYN